MVMGCMIHIRIPTIVQLHHPIARLHGENDLMTISMLELKKDFMTISMTNGQFHPVLSLSQSSVLLTVTDCLY